MAWFEDFLVRYPELTLFLVIAIGYLIGGAKLGGFSLGPVAGSLFAGILVGQFAQVPVSGMMKSFLFLLFIFGIGYSVGPQFMRALRRDGLKLVLLALICCLTGLLTAIAVAKLLGLDPGFAAGLISGSLTESPAIGTATEAINGLALPAEERARLVAHVAVAHAVCYIFGAIGAILFLSTVGPALLGLDLKAEALKLEERFGISRSPPDAASAYRRFELRAYQIAPDAPSVGRTIADVEAEVALHRLYIQRLRRGGALLEHHEDIILAAGDVIAVAGRRETLVELLGPRILEVEDRELLDVPLAAVDLLLTSRDAAGKPLSATADAEWARSLYLRGVSRGGQELPISPGLVLERGDVLRLVGPEPVVARAASHLGTIVAPTTATDFVVLGLAIFLGGLAGVLITFPIGGMKISLSTSVGALLAGLLVGHLRTRFPLFGRIPDGAVALMTALGLAAFIAMTGLQAGPIFLSSLAEAGIGLFLGGVVVTLMPLTVGLFFGRYVLRLNPILLLGGLAGSLTMTAGMAAVQDRSESPVAVLGYTPAVPFGHILLTTWGTIIVGIMAS